jgi:aryl-alcohol dehydrogenase-like predicted oxidoreductase
MYRKRFEKKQYWDIAESFTKYATTVGISPAALAVAWVASHPMVTAPVIGARDMKQLKDTLQFLDVKLSVEDRAKITALSVDPQES